MNIDVSNLEDLFKALSSNSQFEEIDEKRTLKRTHWNAPMEIDIVEHYGGATHVRRIRVIMDNISQGGFGFTFDQFIYPETVIRACFDRLDGAPVLIGVVRSCVSQGRMHHRIGVELRQCIRNGVVSVINSESEQKKSKAKSKSNKAKKKKKKKSKKKTSD